MAPAASKHKQAASEQFLFPATGLRLSELASLDTGAISSKNSLLLDLNTMDSVLAKMQSAISSLILQVDEENHEGEAQQAGPGADTTTVSVSLLHNSASSCSSSASSTSSGKTTSESSAALALRLVATASLNVATFWNFKTLSALTGLKVISMACVPIVAPFNTPPVAYAHWCRNKRAVAFQRSLFFLCVAQGGLAMAKFFAGNLIGGFFDAMIAGTGLYAAVPDGVTMLSTYLVFAGFNGVMDLLQLLQMYHGVIPLYLLPFQYPAFRPLLLLLGCYFTYEFHKELSAIFQGYGCAGAQDSYFVQAMSHDIWGPPPGCSEHEERLASDRVGGLGGDSGGRGGSSNWGSGILGGSGLMGMGGGGLMGGTASGGSGAEATNGPSAPLQQRRFAPFGGEGRRLGQDEEH
mmetsp:Transcript_4882/g.12100  ORF Transcript_4882/g.12100 Transcript_4882/m.12100 type:complete len:407 (+) Transcript_4882:118-1338(+)|eukprot:CAMPEP_0178992408 /NCGR_PEP_ID=MMETSP0795-20121207/6093_1 /TAXON_ID=88552 /ORGANISM="Amoebophrya sp., Strain Ameob2" /LENGTH=406 /DNA_ID=CAMNT_0020684277 /DNA_START=80 /DNA_END=1300 /DNA_ORIENTATION=+